MLLLTNFKIKKWIPGGCFILFVLLTGYSIQAATLNVSSTTLNADHNERKLTVRITSDIDWTVSENISWLNCSVVGSGDEIFNIYMEANTTLTRRTGTIQISGTDVTTKTITITQLGVTADIYETNNSEATSYNTNFVFDNDIAVIYIDEATIQSNTDVDYYKLNLPAGYTYKISSELFSSNEDDLKYSVNAVYSYKIENETWSFTSKDTLSDFISTGGNVYFKVQPNIPGDYGTYGLKIILSRGIGSPTLSAPNTVYLSNEANSTDISVISNTNWNIVKGEYDISWLNLISNTGSNNGTFTFSVEKNNSLTSRYTTLTLSANGVLSQTINVIQTAIDLADDNYEPNDTETTAKELTVTFTDNMARATTNGAIISSSNDVDYYKIFLPEGFSYSVSGILHDRLENNDLIDSKVAYKIGAGSWSSFDDTKIEDFTFTGGDFIYFKVAPYFLENKGRYALDIFITKNTATPTITLSDTLLYINANDNSANTFKITSNSGWKVTKYDPWLTVSPESGWGDATVTVTANANIYLDPRLTFITVSCPTIEDDSITITQSGEGLPLPDSYETNDTEITANDLSVIFNNDTAIIKITESSIHSNSDVDYYKIHLPSGYSYLVSSRLQDAFSQNDGGFYSLDAIYSYKQGDSGTWSFPEDTELPDFIITDEEYVYFKVQPFAYEYKGSYSLDIKIYRATGSPSLAISQNNITLSSEKGNNESIAITSSDANWRVVPSESWLTVNTTNGTGNANIIITASANGSEMPRWAFVTVSGNGVLPQTIRVDQKGKDPNADFYEANNSEDTAYEGNIAYNNNLGCYSTYNANLNTSTDVDYYQINFAAGNYYTITPTLNDAYVSAHLTVDAKISYKIGNSTWSSPEDTKIDPFTISGGTVVYFKVEAYNPGETGTYQMKIIAERVPYTLELSKTSLNLAATAGSASFNITSNINWTSSRSETWITLNTTSGTNNGNISFNATANPNNSARTATITVTGGGITKTLSVNQNAQVVASLTVSATSLPIAATANSATTFNITSNISWNVTSSAQWLTANVNSGINNSTIHLLATENSALIPRSATITVSGSGITRTITVSQSAAAPFLTASATALSITESANNMVTFNVNSNTRWSASSSQTWLIVGTTSATGNAGVKLTATANSVLNTRTATVTITGSGITRVINVTQAAANPVLTISAATLNIDVSANNTAIFDINSNISWTLTSSEIWLTPSSTSGSNNGNITLTATANPTTSPRTANVTVTGLGITRSITITQAPGNPILTVSSSNLSISSSDYSSTTFDIISNSNWTVASSETWLTANVNSGINNGTITLTAPENIVITPRSATITVTGSGITKTITVTQAGVAPVLTASTATLDINAAANSTATFDITSNTSWTATSSETWLTFGTASGTGNANITLTASTNESVSTRTATVTVTGSNITRTITVTQAGAEPVLTVSKTTANINAPANITATFDITSNTSWTVTSSETWLTPNTASGANNAAITLTAGANETTSARTATVTVTGSGITKTISLTQSGKTMGTNDVEVSNGVKFYPNPVMDKLTIELDGKSVDNRVMIYSEKGELKSDKTYNASNFDVEMNSFSAGVYFIKIVNSKESKTIKIVKKN